MRNTSPTILALVLLTAVSGSALGQAVPGLTPVDQAVGDIDLLATSLRVVELGSRSEGQQNTLFKVDWFAPTVSGPLSDQPPLLPASIQPTYYRQGPGFRARLSRMDYLIPQGRRRFTFNTTPSRDGVFIELVPANTVFELGPTTWPAAEGVGALQARPDHRIDLRVDTRIDGRVKGSPRSPAEP